MKNRIQHVWNDHFDPDGEPRWPDTPDSRNKLASRLLGASVIASVDDWLELALDVLRNAEPSPARRRERTRSEAEDRQRSVFATLSQEQRVALEALLFQTVRGSLHSILVRLDQFPGARLDIVAFHPDTEQKLASILEGDILDLHDRLSSWIEEFSDYVKELEAS